MAQSFLYVNDIMLDVSYRLIEQPVIAHLTAPTATGLQTVTVDNTNWMYNGAILVIDQGLPSMEAITLTGFISGTSITANFTKPHLNGALIKCATFSSGQPDHVLFNQSEILGYYSDTVNNFLNVVRMLAAVSTENLTATVRYYANPANAIRIERISIGGYELWPKSTRQLDLQDPNWAAVSEDPPQSWFEDGIGTGQHGYSGNPAANTVAELWYSTNFTLTPQMTDLFCLPDPFAHIIMYGILEKCFAKDGEQRDSQRAMYCGKMYAMGVMLGVKFLKGLSAAMDDMADAPKFVPFPLKKETV